MGESPLHLHGPGRAGRRETVSWSRAQDIKYQFRGDIEQCAPRGRSRGGREPRRQVLETPLESGDALARRRHGCIGQQRQSRLPSRQRERYRLVVRRERHADGVRGGDETGGERGATEQDGDPRHARRGAGNGRQE